MRLGSELTINLNHLAYNYEKVKGITPNNETIFMVKANAYGHGISEITDFSFNELGIKRFGCASLGEAIFIRESMPHLLCDLMVFSDLNLSQTDSLEAYSELGITPVISSLENLNIFLSSALFKNVPLVLKFDTGMHRLGISVEEIKDLVLMLKKFGRLEIDHAMTHFSSSYLPNKKGGKTQQQLDRFETILKELRDYSLTINETSCANSGAVEQGVGLNYSHIRPGLMLYGAQSYEWGGKCVSTLKTTILKIFPVKKGMPIGYGAHVCGKDGHIVLLPLGYGDGILTLYSGLKFDFYGKKAQILGRVNMDLVSVFFEDLPSSLKVGGEFVIWGEGIHNINEIAAQLKTIPYQLFTAISTRVPRRYII